MPNQSDPLYTELGFKIDHEKKILIIKQMNSLGRDIMRMYRIKLNRIISAYIEGPFGFKDDQLVNHEGVWRFVITFCLVNADCILDERDIVLHLESKEKAEMSLDTLNEMIGIWRKTLIKIEKFFMVSLSIQFKDDDLRYLR